MSDLDIDVVHGDDVYKTLEEQVGVKLAIAFANLKVHLNLEYGDIQFITETFIDEEKKIKGINMFMSGAGFMSFGKFIENEKGEIFLENM